MTLLTISKQSVHAYCSKFTNIMNKPLKNKTFLDILRNTRTTPCHEKDNKGNKENNRPFSTLSNFQSFFKQYSKVFFKQLSSYMELKFFRYLTVFRKHHDNQLRQEITKL